MSTGSTLLIAAMSLLVLCSAVSAAARRQAGDWNYYHFDGQGFRAGKPADSRAFLAVQDRLRPVVLAGNAGIEATALPAGTGALAGICYLTSSGGRIGVGYGYVPSPLTAVTVYSGTMPVTTVTSDENGYFVTLLPAGSYQVGSGAFRTGAEVVEGTTVLVPLRTGKRMVD